MVCGLTMHAANHHLKSGSHGDFHASIILLFATVRIISTFQSVLVKNTYVKEGKVFIKWIIRFLCFNYWAGPKKYLVFFWTKEYLVFLVQKLFFFLNICIVLFEGGLNIKKCSGKAGLYEKCTRTFFQYTYLPYHIVIVYYLISYGRKNSSRVCPNSSHSLHLHPSRSPFSTI